MAKRSVNVGAEHGVHMRVAGTIVQEACKFISDITIRKDGVGTANAKSILSVISLAIKNGEQIELEADGTDCDLALDSLIPLFE